MTTDDVLVLAWLVLAHLVADFLLQTGGMVADKFTSGRRAWRGLIAHGAGVGLCLTPFAAVYGDRGVALLVVVTIAHVMIDRWKVRATRHAEAVALASAHRRHEIDGEGSGQGLGPAWTPLPGALFVADQLLHLAVLGAAWLVLIAPIGPVEPWLVLMDRFLPAAGAAEFHRWSLATAVVASLVIVNVRAGALFVATLVRPRQSVTGASPSPASPPAAPPAPRGWQVRIGPLVAIAEPAPAAPAPADPSRTGPPGSAPDRTHPRDGHARPERIGATIGVLERLLIVVFMLTGATAAVGFVIAAKTIARFKQLDDRDFAEYYLLGTLASVSVAIGSALLAQAALAVP